MFIDYYDPTTSISFNTYPSFDFDFPQLDLYIPELNIGLNDRGELTATTSIIQNPAVDSSVFAWENDPNNYTIDIDIYSPDMDWTVTYNGGTKTVSWEEYSAQLDNINSPTIDIDTSSSNSAIITEADSKDLGISFNSNFEVLITDPFTDENIVSNLITGDYSVTSPEGKDVTHVDSHGNTYSVTYSDDGSYTATAETIDGVTTDYEYNAEGELVSMFNDGGASDAFYSYDVGEDGVATAIGKDELGFLYEIAFNDTISTDQGNIPVATDLTQYFTDLEETWASSILTEAQDITSALTFGLVDEREDVYKSYTEEGYVVHTSLTDSTASTYDVAEWNDGNPNADSVLSTSTFTDGSNLVRTETELTWDPSSWIDAMFDTYSTHIVTPVDELYAEAGYTEYEGSALGNVAADMASVFTDDLSILEDMYNIGDTTGTVLDSLASMYIGTMFIELGLGLIDLLQQSMEIGVELSYLEQFLGSTIAFGNVALGVSTVLDETIALYEMFESNDLPLTDTTLQDVLNAVNSTTGVNSTSTTSTDTDSSSYYDNMISDSTNYELPTSMEIEVNSSSGAIAEIEDCIREALSRPGRRLNSMFDKMAGGSEFEPHMAGGALFNVDTVQSSAHSVGAEYSISKFTNTMSVPYNQLAGSSTFNKHELRPM
jgi:hypothetical protein